jgi:hypothetical protein
MMHACMEDDGNNDMTNYNNDDKKPVTPMA